MGLGNFGKLWCKGPGILLGHAGGERTGKPGTLLWGDPEGSGRELVHLNPLNFRCLPKNPSRIVRSKRGL